MAGCPYARNSRGCSPDWRLNVALIVETQWCEVYGQVGPQAGRLVEASLIRQGCVVLERCGVRCSACWRPWGVYVVCWNSGSDGSFRIRLGISVRALDYLQRWP
jgi:hypothetical protein